MLTDVMQAAAEAKPASTGRDIKLTMNPRRSMPMVREMRPTIMVMDIAIPSRSSGSLVNAEVATIQSGNTESKEPDIRESNAVCVYINLRYHALLWHDVHMMYSYIYARHWHDTLSESYYSLLHLLSFVNELTGTPSNSVKFESLQATVVPSSKQGTD
jgi:hypothetical protein